MNFGEEEEKVDLRKIKKRKSRSQGEIIKSINEACPLVIS